MALRSRATLCPALIAAILAAGAGVATRALLARAAPRQSSSRQQSGAKPAAPPTIPPYTIKVQRNLVMIRAVVRNRRGELVDGLKQGDFRILDNGKPQQITEFSIRRETTEKKVPIVGAPAKPGQPSTLAKPAAQPPRPRATHFIGFYFDDNHLTIRTAMEARQAAEKFLASSWHPGDYAGVFTATGVSTLRFTGDLSRVHKAIAGINARPRDTHELDCPHITPYQAYLIVERADPVATAIAGGGGGVTNSGKGAPAGAWPLTGYLDPTNPGNTIVWDKARVVWNYTRLQSQLTFSEMAALIRRMASLPGERTLAFVSPGLIVAPENERVGHLIDLALRDHVTIGALDARGLYTLSPARYAKATSCAPPATGPLLMEKTLLAHTEASVADDPLAELAEGTGGTFFWNNNDLVEGFKQVTSEAAVEYHIGFSPNDMKPNGAYHSVKVKITAPGKYQIQARKGYYAPTKSEEARASITNPIESAFYSNSSSQAFPVAIVAHSAKAGPGRATVSVTIHVGIGSLKFHARHGHREGTLVFRTGLFDAKHAYVTGDERTLPLKLDGTRFASLSRTGIFAVTRLNVPPGNYTLREVVADKNSGKLSTVSQPLQIE